jgi:hypothetical protein
MTRSAPTFGAFFFLAAAAAAAFACSPEAPVAGVEARCADACVAKAHSCTAAQCARGCRLVLDRLVEHEGAHVLACVARADHHACDDAAFAECAAWTGPNADGGPAPPRAPSDDDDSSSL